MIALAFAACQEKPEPDNSGNGNGNGNGQEPGGNTTAEAYDNITVVLKAANLKTAWVAGDEIRVYGVTAAGADVEAAYVLKEGAGSATGKFAPAAGETAIEKGGKDYFAAYPNDPDRTFAQHNTFTAVIPSEQTAPMPLFAHATDAATLELASFVGAIKFTLEGEAELKNFLLSDNNSNSILSGNVTYNAKTGKASIKNSSATKHEITYVLPGKLVLNGTSDPFIIEVPAGALAEGGKLTLFDMNDNAAAVIDIPAQTIAAGVVKDLGKLSFQAVSQTVDISVAGTANSYIIPSTGEYKFKAVKGNSSEAVAASSVEVVWETCMNPEEESAVKLIDKVAIEGNYVVFETVKPLVPGNALIAAKNSNGEILWSWHLWLPETEIQDITNNPDAPFAEGDIMDRNLGALIVTPESADGYPPYKSYGLFFEWGRKDPFTGPFNVIGAATEAVAGSISLADAIANPTLLPSGEAENADNKNNWCSTDIKDLWGSYIDESGIVKGGKTIYDPCPNGYRVPVYDTDKLLWTKTNDGWTFDPEHGWFKFDANNCVFPAQGYLSGKASITNEHIRSVIWSATYNSFERGYDAHINMGSDSMYNYNSYYKYAAGAVRCVRAN